MHDKPYALKTDSTQNMCKRTDNTLMRCFGSCLTRLCVTKQIFY